MTRLDLTVSQVRRRDLVVADHRGPHLHLSMHKTLLALKSGTLQNSPYTEFDAINAAETMPCSDCTLAREFNLRLHPPLLLGSTSQVISFTCGASPSYLSQIGSRNTK